MFDDILRPSIRVDSRKTYVVPLSIGAHVLVIGAAVLGAVMAPGILPVPVAALTAVLARDVVLPPPPPAAPRSGSAPRQASAHADAAPVEAPSTIAPEPTVDPAPAALLGTVEGPGNVAEVLGQSIVAPPVAPIVPIIGTSRRQHQNAAEDQERGAGVSGDAVRQWEFTPTQLNDTPVPVIMTVTVNFSLR